MGKKQKQDKPVIIIIVEILIILFLILLNGIFAMAEIAVVSARKSKLQQRANEGDKNAQSALELAGSPSRFLSTVQIGITFIGIFAGAFGGGSIAENMSAQLKTIPVLAPYADGLSLLIVVAAITYLSLIIGELVPKRLALNSPEKIATFFARPMNILSSVASPLVDLLSISSDLVLRTLDIKPSLEPSVSEEEVKMLVREGTKVGVFNIAEKDIFERTLRLGDKKVNTIMTPRQEITWLDINSSYSTLKKKLAKNPHSNFPVCDRSLDKIMGIIRTEDLLTDFLTEAKIDVEKSLRKPLFVPETLEVLKVLELFKTSGIHMALVIDEYGSVLGLLSLTDILEEIVGDIPSIEELGEEKISKREDGSFLIDGLTPIEEFKEFFELKKIPGERSGSFNTIGGFIMHKLGKIPAIGDKFEWEGMTFEVVDMDENRIDKILVHRKV